MEAIAHGVKDLDQKDVHHELKSMYGGYSKETTVHHNAVHTALNIDKHRVKLAEMAQQVKPTQKPELSLLQAENDGEASAETVQAPADGLQMAFQFQLAFQAVSTSCCALSSHA